MKNFAFALVLLTATANAFAANAKTAEPFAAVSPDPVVGKWKVDRAEGEDVIWTFYPNGTMERHSRHLHERGNWKRLNELNPPGYQCVLNGAAAVIKVSYSGDPEHLSIHSDNNKTRATAKRLQLK
jgi:hypothetical protein